MRRWPTPCGRLAGPSPRSGRQRGRGPGSCGRSRPLAAKASGPERSADRPVLFEALLDAVDKAAGDETALWVLDDIHWADDSTWEFVRYAARRVADLALVLAVTYREEEIGRRIRGGRAWSSSSESRPR